MLNLDPINPLRAVSDTGQALSLQERDELRRVVAVLDALLIRIDLLGHDIAGNHISHGLELLREASDHDALPLVPLP